MKTLQAGFVEVNLICRKILEEFSKIYKINVEKNLQRLGDYLEKFYRSELNELNTSLNICYIQGVADTHNFNIESSSHYNVLKFYEQKFI